MILSSCSPVSLHWHAVDTHLISTTCLKNRLVLQLQLFKVELSKSLFGFYFMYVRGYNVCHTQKGQFFFFLSYQTRQTPYLDLRRNEPK